MKAIYLDTNVILSKWSKIDPYFDDSNLIVSAIEKSQVLGYFSGFGLVEVASVVERQSKKFSTDQFAASLADEFIKAIRSIPHLEIMDVVVPTHILICGRKTGISAVHLKAIDVAKRISLKTLDNVHIAIIVLLSTFHGVKIDYYVTGDKEILSKGKDIKKCYNISVVDPKELVRIEAL